MAECLFYDTWWTQLNSAAWPSCSRASSAVCPLATKTLPQSSLLLKLCCESRFLLECQEIGFGQLSQFLTQADLAALWPHLLQYGEGLAGRLHEKEHQGDHKLQDRLCTNTTHCWLCLSCSRAALVWGWMLSQEHQSIELSICSYWMLAPEKELITKILSCCIHDFSLHAYILANWDLSKYSNKKLSNSRHLQARLQLLSPFKAPKLLVLVTQVHIVEACCACCHRRLMLVLSCDYWNAMRIQLRFSPLLPTKCAKRQQGDSAISIRSSHSELKVCSANDYCLKSYISHER